MHIIRVQLFLVLILTLIDANDSSNLLSSIKKEQVEVEKKINLFTTKKLKYDWINPITTSYTYTKNGQFDATSSSKIFKISLNQPIFKSGGIYFAIKYSDANREFLDIATSLKEKELIANLYSLLLNLKKIDLEIKKSSYMIENAKIDILRKKEQFENDLIDSSFLNSAILQSSSRKHQLLNLKSKRFELLSQFKNFSDKNYTKIKPPKFVLLSEDEFIEKNLELNLAKSEILKNKNLKNMMISSYFPTLSIFANYTKNLNNQSKSFIRYGTSYGFSLTMPLFDINRGENIELRRLELLKSKLTLIDKEKEMKNLYNSTKKRIEILKERIKIAKNDEKLYNSLVKATYDSYKIGQKSSYDVEVLKNSKKASMLDIKIYELDIELELLNLYKKVLGEI